MDDQNMDSSFPAKENPNMGKVLFDWPIVLQYNAKAKYRKISRKFFGHEVLSAERSLNQPKATRVFFLFDKPIKSLFYFVRVFISRSYENRFTWYDYIYINAQVVNGDEKGRRVCYRNIEHNANNCGGNVFADLEYCWTRARPRDSTTTWMPQMLRTLHRLQTLENAKRWSSR